MSHFDKKMAVLACAMVASLGFMGCSHNDTRHQPDNTVSSTTVPEDVNKPGEDMHHHMTSVINFEKGSFALTDASKDVLRKLVQNLDRNQVDNVKVAAWSDNPFPMQNDSLSDADRELASRRGDAIENFFEDELKISDVDVYNMAKKSNWLSRLFNTKDAELKSSFGYQGQGPITDSDVMFLKQNGGPSKAAIILERDMD